MPISDQGLTVDRYTLIPRTLIFLNKEDNFLLIKGSPKKRLWANLYNGIGGHVERGEDLLSAAQREIVEETGLIPIDLWLCGMVTIDTETNPGIGIFIFRGEAQDVELKNSLEGTLTWISMDQIFTLPLVEDLYTLLPKIFKFYKGAPPFSALYTYDQNGGLHIKFASND
jgi:8-oxo-dGTP diphosphatase